MIPSAFMSFKNKTVIVTGGSRGIGRGIAMAFAEKGAKLCIVYRSDEAAAKETIARLPGTKHICVQGDVSQANGVESIVSTAIEKLGHLDILVNNAGVGIDHGLEHSSFEHWQESWQQIIETNLIGPANMCYCVAQHMISNKSGRIVNIGSRGAFRGEPDQPAYGASKAGLHSLSQSLAKALAPHNIAVGVVAPGYVETEMTAELLSTPEGDNIRAQSPFKRLATPEEVAHAVLFLASEAAEFSSGSIIDVNGASYLRS